MTHELLLHQGVDAGTISPLIEQIFHARKSDKDAEFVLKISSLGGDMDSAIRFFEFIKIEKVKLTTIGFGQVDSAAILIFLAGQIRKISKDCKLRFHQPTYNMNWNGVTLEILSESLANLKALDKQYFKILQSAIPKLKNFKKTFKIGKSFTAHEALNLGIATEII